MSLPDPLTPADCDLRGMPFMALDVVRLLDSDFFALSTGEEFKAGVALWAKSWNQIPAGSLPVNDRVLAHLAGVDQKRWPKVREIALHGWVEASDGRLYHPVVAEKAREAWEDRKQYRSDRSADAERKAREREERSQMFAALKGAGLNLAWNTKTGDLRRLMADHGLSVQTDSRDQSQEPVTDLSQPVTRTVTAKTETGTGIEEKSFALVAADAATSVGKVSSDEVRTAFAEWNDLAKRVGLPTARDFTDDRRKKIASRLRAVGLDGWRSVLATIEASEFCRGGGERGWRISLDDLFQNRTWNKLRDGGYGSVKPAAGEMKLEVWEQLVRMWRDDEPWPESAGPAPDQPGTRVPKQLLIQPIRGAA